jgi:hypothetical protein
LNPAEAVIAFPAAAILTEVVRHVSINRLDGSANRNSKPAATSIMPGRRKRRSPLWPGAAVNVALLMGTTVFSAYRAADQACPHEGCN